MFRKGCPSGVPADAVILPAQVFPLMNRGLKDMQADFACEIQSKNNDSRSIYVPVEWLDINGNAKGEDKNRISTDAEI